MVNNARAQDKKIFTFDSYGDYAAIHPPPGPLTKDHEPRIQNDAGKNKTPYIGLRLSLHARAFI